MSSFDILVLRRSAPSPWSGGGAPVIHMRRGVFPLNWSHWSLFLSSAGELTPEEVDKVVAVINNPLAYNIPQWFLNRQKDIHTGQYKQIVANNLQAALREDINDLKKMRYVSPSGGLWSASAHRGYRHHWGVRVRGQHTKTTGRHGKMLGVVSKK